MPESIAVVCPGCQARMRAPAEMAGRTARCPVCKAQVQVPTAPPAEPVLELEDCPPVRPVTQPPPKTPAKKAVLLGLAFVVGTAVVISLVARGRPGGEAGAGRPGEAGDSRPGEAEATAANKTVFARSLKPAFRLKHFEWKNFGGGLEFVRVNLIVEPSTPDSDFLHFDVTYMGVNDQGVDCSVDVTTGGLVSSKTIRFSYRAAGGAPDWTVVRGGPYSPSERMYLGGYADDLLQACRAMPYKPRR